MYFSKITTFVFISLISLNLNASEIVSLVEGRNISRNAVEASDENTGIVTLEITLEEKREKYGLKAFVAQENDGFTCVIQNTYVLTEAQITETKVQRTYRIEVMWYPGQDWSSCSIEVSADELKRTGVVLYIEGPYNSPVYDDYRPKY